MTPTKQPNPVVLALRERPWCYDESGQQFQYVEPEVADAAIAEIERLEAALAAVDELRESRDEAIAQARDAIGENAKLLAAVEKMNEPLSVDEASVMFDRWYAQAHVAIVTEPLIGASLAGAFGGGLAAMRAWLKGGA